MDKSLINENIYREPYSTPNGKRSKVADQLALSYFNKCAYCERIQKADIEHYRPKNKVQGEDIHPGYYWLCYEWTNLLPSCITCNREGAKHNHFPILGIRANTHPIDQQGQLDFAQFKASSTSLMAEQPYLLHPEIDEPESCFAFDVAPNGIGINIEGIDDEGRGEKTIAICKLNRQELQLDRKQRVIDDFTDGIDAAFVRYQDDENKLLEQLENELLVLKAKAENPQKTHTLLRRYIVKTRANFEKIVGPYLMPQQRQLLAVIFDAVVV